MSGAQTTTAAEATTRVDNDLDFNALRAKLQALIDKNFPPADDMGWNCIEAQTATYVVYSYNGEMYKVNFTLDTQGEPMLGERTKVKKTWAAEANKRVKILASESVEITGINKVGKDSYKVRIITEGKTLQPQQPLDVLGFPGRTAFRLYTAEALQQAVTDRCFENVPCVLRTEKEHLDFMQRLDKGANIQEVNSEIRRVVGNIHAAEAVSLPDGKLAIDALLDLKHHGKAAKKIREDLATIERLPTSEALGLSVTCQTLTTLEDEDAPNPTLRVWEIGEVFSVDPCRKGNAGGYFLDAAEAQQFFSNKPIKMQRTEKQRKALDAQLLAAAEAMEGGAPEGEAVKGLPDDWGVYASEFIFANFPNAKEVWESVDEIQALPVPKQIALFESAQKAKAAGTTAPEPEKTETAAAEAAKTGANNDVELAKLRADVDALTKQTKIVPVLAHLETELAKTTFTEDMKKHVRGLVSLNAAESTEKVDGILRDFKNLAAGMGHGDAFYGAGAASVNMDENDKLKRSVMGFFFPPLNTSEAVRAQAEKILGYNPLHADYQGFHSLKDMFLSVLGKRDTRIEAFYTNAAEAASMEILSQLSTDAMNVHLLAAFRANVQFDSWQKIVKKMPVNDLRGVHVQTYGQFTVGLGIPVSKTADYAELELKGNEEVVYKALRRGNLFGISIEDIINDNVGFVQSIAPALARMAKRDIYKQIWNLLNDGFSSNFTGWNPDGSGQTTAAFFHSTWGNAGTGSLTSDNVVAARNKMLQYKEIGSGEPLEVIPKYLIHQTRDYNAARVITTPAAGENNQVATTAQSLDLERIEVPFFNDSVQERWWLANDPLDFPGIEVSFLYGRQEPAIIPEAAGTGKNFSADLAQWKITYYWGAARINPRAFFGSKVS